jgi:hypothetical protein
MQTHEDLPLDPLVGALLAQATAAHNGLFALLVRLANKGAIDRADVDMIAKGMAKVWDAPQVRDNELAMQMHQQSEGFLASLNAILDKRESS